MRKRLVCFAMALLLAASCGACGKQTASDDGKTKDEQAAALTEQERSETQGKTKAAQLLGEDNAFAKMYLAVELDQASYEEDLTKMVYVLVDAFATARLGTNRIQAVVDGLIPKSVYAKKTTTSDKWDAIYSYAYKDKLCKYISMEFSSDGEPTSASIKADNVNAFIKDAIACGVFKGSTEHFEIDESLTDLSVLRKKMNITREVAVVMLTVLDEYNAEWIDGSNDRLIDHFEK